MHTSDDMFKVLDVVKRAENMGILQGERITAVLDIEQAHAIYKLRLDELLAADDSNFVHDIIGIQKNIDRDTGEMDQDFLPRYAGKH